MQARLTTRPEQDVIAAIQALDLDSVKRRVMDPELGEGWTQEYADSIEAAYKNYLTMLVKYPDDAEDILLSEDVDEFWHTHILQTIRYTEDCQRVFGNFLHHEPHVGERTAEDFGKRAALAEKTRRLYQLEFGNADGTAWSGIASGAEGLYRNQVDKAAWSSAAMKAKDAAWSSASIRAGGAAWSSAAIKAEGAAWSSAAIKAKDAAWSSASIRASGAAWSSAAIKAKGAAWSSASIKAGGAAWSSASIRAGSAAWSSTAIRKDLASSTKDVAIP